MVHYLQREWDVLQISYNLQSYFLLQLVRRFRTRRQCYKCFLNLGNTMNQKSSFLDHQIWISSPTWFWNKKLQVFLLCVLVLNLAWSYAIPRYKLLSWKEDVNSFQIRLNVCKFSFFSDCMHDDVYLHCNLCKQNHRPQAFKTIFFTSFIHFFILFSCIKYHHWTNISERKTRIFWSTESCTFELNVLTVAKLERLKEKNIWILNLFF